MAEISSDVTIELVDADNQQFKVVSKDSVSGQRFCAGYIDRYKETGFWFRPRLGESTDTRFGPTVLRGIARALEILNDETKA